MSSVGVMSVERTSTLHVETPDGTALCDRCEVAETPLRRMLGLLGRRGLAQGEGLLIRPANSIHMWFMRFAIDAVFLDAGDRVLRITPELRPWRLAICRGSKAVLELPAGACARAGLRQGDRLRLGHAEAAG